MHRNFVPFVAMATALFVSSASIASECEPSTSDPEFSGGGFYVDNDPCQPDCVVSLHVYQESNDIEGLQRGDSVKNDTCGGQIEADFIVYSLLL